jgi:hypothetical protein
VTQVLEDGEEREKRSRPKGRNQEKEIDWDKTALRWLLVFVQAMQGKARSGMVR